MLMIYYSTISDRFFITYIQ